ncbi:phage tail protein [Corynebacterium sp. TAE3-ERU2]|uniref:Gp37-like protein n=1 Tax=Corynebacterium sp. TAE3-ERU2 TaxID=2849497 RepID=UPI001C48BF0B|nr:phage tail protein [Corynebacterium sp. TAE3-ERU2]MBV7302936.1 phage tail protein [Corynebacterium sp. TAE3-ERU2]
MTIARLTAELSEDEEQRLDEVRRQCLALHDTMRELADRPPVTRLWDGNFAGGIVVHGEIEQHWPEPYNERAVGELVLPADHGLAQWVLNNRTRGAENVFATVDQGRWRWSGILTEYQVTVDDKGQQRCVLTFEHDIYQLEKIVCWPNPFMPASGPQFPKVWPWIGPSVYGLKLMLFVNLLRYSGNLWQLPDNPLDPTTWTEGLKPWTWPIMVKPSSLLLDGSEWAAFDARMDSWLEVATPILEDCQLMVQTRRWLDGDPPPWEGALVSHGQLIVDIVDKSGVWDQTSLGGTLAGGLVRTVTSHADNLVDEVVNTVTYPKEPAEYTVSRFFGTHPSQPWVIYRDGEHTNIKASNFTHRMAGPVQITAGGKSAPGVNEAQSLAIQLTGNILGSIFRLDTLGTIVDTAVKPLYEDVWAAFMSFKSPLRTARQGRFYLHEEFVPGADQAYMLSSVLAFRRGFFDTREVSTFELEVGNGAPYFVGWHFGLGDRIAATNRFHGERLFVEQVRRLELHITRDYQGFKIVCGDPRATEFPWDRGLRKIQRVTGLLRRLAVL